ncbi:hypothetical protein GFS31_27090 [Leptolyngbya sp. BL0902]|nr:hypothetical protein GFS31_27090 [Leptolyngbya sp. BL0902]
MPPKNKRYEMAPMADLSTTTAPIEPQHGEPRVASRHHSQAALGHWLRE